MSDPINFRPDPRGWWTWHGGVTTLDQLSGHWTDEPCAICKANALKPPTHKVTAVDHDSGTITISQIVRGK